MDSALLKAATLVAKEDVGDLRFPKEEVFDDIEQQKELKAKIDKALKLGNALKGKVKILFELTIFEIQLSILGFKSLCILFKFINGINIYRKNIY